MTEPIKAVLMGAGGRGFFAFGGYATKNPEDLKFIAVAEPDHRSSMNVTFHIGQERLLQKFLSESEKEGLYALKGHSSVGGVRASIYNAMPLDGVKKLADFMKEFERRNG